MPKLQDIDGYLMDAVSYDAEQVDAIVAFLNEPDSEWRGRFERAVQRPEVLTALVRMVREGLLEVYVSNADGSDFEHCGERVWPDRPIGELYFDLTGKGRVRYLNYEF